MPIRWENTSSAYVDGTRKKARKNIYEKDDNNFWPLVQIEEDNCTSQAKETETSTYDFTISNALTMQVSMHSFPSPEPVFTLLIKKQFLSKLVHFLY